MALFTALFLTGLIIFWPTLWLIIFAGRGKYVYLTFDDGPDPKNTPRVLEILNKHGVKATFFVIGSKAQKYPEIIKKIALKGHSLGNHSFSHPSFLGIYPPDRIYKEYARCEKVVFDLTSKTPRFARLPQGITTIYSYFVLKSMGYTPINWSVSTKDWEETTSANDIVKKVLSNAKPGSVILFHDSLDSNEGTQSKVAEKEKKDVTPPGFGRIAAQTAKQVIHQKIREAEKGAIMEEFEEKIGALVSGLILRFDGPNVRVDLGRTEAIMAAEDRIPNERLSLNQRLTFLIKAINETPRGKEIFLSRAAPEFVEKLFAREVPEISSKSVEIKAIAREAGVRTKIAVHSAQSGVDPVGSCVGQKGVRVQAVTNEIGGERVDVIPYNADVSELIKSSLSPAENLSVTLDEKSKTAKVTAPEDQLSMAIGKDGQNVRLTAKLTGYRIEVEGNGEVTANPEETPEPKTVEEKIEKKEDITEDTQSDQNAESAEPEKPTEEVKSEAKEEEVKEDTKSE